jgi:hypothetical protein
MKCEGLFHLGCLSPPLSEIPLGEWFCSDCISHASPTHLPAPAVFKEEPAPGSDSPNKRGRGRPRKYGDQQSQIAFMSEGAGTPVGPIQGGGFGFGPGPMDLGTPIAGEKRERSPDYDDDDGSDYDGTFSLNCKSAYRRSDGTASARRCSWNHQEASWRLILRPHLHPIQRYTTKMNVSITKNNFQFSSKNYGPSLLPFVRSTTLELVGFDRLVYFCYKSTISM